MRRQRGIVLVALVAMLALGALGYLLSSLNAAASQRPAVISHGNGDALELARRALLGWAAQNAIDGSDINPGRLPCPEAAGYIGDPDNEGIMSPFCGAGTVIGRLPWRTLGLPKLTDGTGEPLWYVVSNGWKLNVGGALLGINSNSVGQLAVNAQSNAAVALIIAPGPAFNFSPNANQLAAGCVARSQARGVTPPNYRDYVECHDIAAASLRTAVVDNTSNAVFNDQVVVVTAADVLAAVEGPVAARIKRDVVPQLKSVYASAQWGASAANPIFPFAAPFADPGTSDFKGALATGQGLLPLNASECNALTAGRCDPSFVRWETGGGAITVSKVGGNAGSWSYNCGPSVPGEVRCDITYSRLCLLPIFAVCEATLDIRLNAQARNVGMTLRTLDTSAITNLSGVSFTSPIGSVGQVNAAATGSVPTASCNPIFILGLFICNASRTTRVSIPVAVFADHPLLTPTAGDAWYWFIANKWHNVAYYAVATSHLPSGPSAHDCVGAADCLTVGSSTLPNNLQAVVTLAGRSVTGTARPNANLTDFLDSTENRNLDNVFEQNRVNRTFNDRFIAVNP